MKKVLPFDIKFRDEIESGKCKVQTNDGRSVRIICWDGPDNLNPIYGCIGDNKDTTRWDEDGENALCDIDSSDEDLCIVIDEGDVSEESDQKQWKPTFSQIMALKDCLDYLPEGEVLEELEGLIVDLKELVKE